MNLQQQLQALSRQFNYNDIDKLTLAKTIEVLDNLAELKHRYKELEMQTPSFTESVVYRQNQLDIEGVINGQQD